MSQEEPSLIRSDHADAAVSVTGGDTGFQPSFKPENVPQIKVPDVPEDATGLPPEALAHIPTLTERVPAQTPAKTPTQSPTQSQPQERAVGEAVPVLEVPAQEQAQDVVEASLETETKADETGDLAPVDEPFVEELTQEPEVEADTWVQQLQVRMDRLIEDIHTLNDRLDRLENKTKV